MSGIVGHSLYALLALKEAERRALPITKTLRTHLPSFVAGAYLGSDIQTMPEAVCVDTGREVGYGTVPLEKSPLTGGAVKPFLLQTPSGPLSPRQVHDQFYGRAHLVFGFTVREKSLHVPWDHLPDYFAAVTDDALDHWKAAPRTLAYVMGWLVHVVSDSLIKGIHPGIGLHLIDGRYTPANRPVQDLISYHDVGIGELGLDWPKLFNDLTATPVETIQCHYMRCAQPSGALGRLFDDGWKLESKDTLLAVLAENRRWVRHHAEDVVSELQLVDGECSQALRDKAGLSYADMKTAAQKAGFRGMLDRMAAQIVDMMAATLQRCPRLGVAVTR